MLILACVALLALAYATPSVIAVLCNAKYVEAVIVINVFLGWTIVGWVAALALASVRRD